MPYGYKCPPGYYWPQGATDKVEWPINTYNDKYGASKVSDWINWPPGK